MRAITKFTKVLKNNMPSILTGVSVVGVVGTAIFSYNAGLKANELLENVNTDDKKELYKKILPVYILPVCTGLATIVSIICTSKLHTMRYEGLLATYALAGQTYRKYREATKKVYGDNADDIIKEEMAKDVYVGADGMYVNIPEYNGGDKMRTYYDSISERLFTSTSANVLNALYHLNRQLMIAGEVSLNTYYIYLGLSPVENGDDIGWTIDQLFDYGDVWLDCMVTEKCENDKKIYEIEYYLLPEEFDE